MEEEELFDQEEYSNDSTCPRCGLRTYDSECSNCGAPVIDHKDDEEEEYDWREHKR